MLIQSLESRQFMSVTPAMDSAPTADTQPAITVEADQSATARRTLTTTKLQSPSNSLVVIAIIGVLIG